ncbi:MAG: agmatinase [Oscillospiraceae bacterium]|jgi:agmatinase|nr:agmatinase [Oscillospiraceae bacterium]
MVKIFGAGFDGTASYRPGARFGPAAIRNEFYGLETYSPYCGKDLNDLKNFTNLTNSENSKNLENSENSENLSFTDLGDLELPFGNTEKVLKAVEKQTAEILADGGFPICIGGEHTVTFGSVKACVNKYPDLHIIHFDAHADLRDEYIGEKLSHACVIRRCYEILPESAGIIHSFGIRSGDKEEFLWADGRIDLHKFNFDGLTESLKTIGNAPIYLTVDLDVLDPGEFPGTGTPEAGGVRFTELLGALGEVFKYNVIAADITELAPNIDHTGISTAAACKVLREIILNIPVDNIRG